MHNHSLTKPQIKMQITFEYFEGYRFCCNHERGRMKTALLKLFCFCLFCFFNDNEGINGWNPPSLKKKDEEPLIKKKLLQTKEFISSQELFDEKIPEVAK